MERRKRREAKIDEKEKKLNNKLNILVYPLASRLYPLSAFFSTPLFLEKPRGWSLKVF